MLALFRSLSHSPTLLSLSLSLFDSHMSAVKSCSQALHTQSPTLTLFSCSALLPALSLFAELSLRERA